MVIHQDDLKKIWDNINTMYLILGQSYSFEYLNLKVSSDDNSFHCKVGNNQFSLEKNFSFLGSPKYKLYYHPYFANEINQLFDELKPIFRDFKIQKLLNK